MSVLALLQAAAPSPESGTREMLRFADLPAPWVIVLVIVPALALVSALAYWREPISTVAKVFLGGLRFLAFALLVAILCRPVLLERREEVFAPEVLVLVDDSASMRRKDAYAADQALRAKLRSLGIDRPEEATRLELARKGIEKELLPRLARRGYVVRLYAFDEDTERIADGRSQTEAELTASLQVLAGRGGGTHLGDAISTALAETRGRFVTDLVLVTDGRNNGGRAPLDAARVAEAAGVALHTVVVGDTRPERNAVLELVEAPSTALAGDELAFTVRVLGRGSADGEPAEVLLEELEPGADPADARLVDRREVVRLDASGDRYVLVAPPGSGDPNRGERRFALSLPPLEGETLTDDNRVEVSIRLSQARIRVLYVEGYPRWEYRRLALDFLRRAEREIEFQGWLASATVDFLQERSPGLDPLGSLPTTREDLLDRYDVVILGDIEPYSLFDDPADAEDFLDALRGFVEAGGGLLVQAGERDSPRSFLGTPLEEVLPIQLDTSQDFGFEGDASVAFRPLLETPQTPHEIVRLVSDAEANRRLWEDVGGLPGFYWYSPVTRAKPGAEVLLRHPSDENGFGRRPLAVTGYYPSGRTLFLAFDSTWRWQKFFGPALFERFWKNSIRWLALGRMRGEDRRYRLETARSSYDLSERVVLEARVLDEDYDPSSEPSQDVRYEGPDGTEQGLALEALEGRPGLYRGSLLLDRPGTYRAWIEVDGKRVTQTEFDVFLPSQENSVPAPDPQTLRALASLAGGQAVELARIDELAGEFPGGEERRQPTSSSLEDLWDRWATLWMALALLALEWVARKRLELV